MGQGNAYLILDQKLDTLDGSSSSFRDGGRDTTHCDKVSAYPFSPALSDNGVSYIVHRLIELTGRSG